MTTKRKECVGELGDFEEMISVIVRRLKRRVSVLPEADQKDFWELWDALADCETDDEVQETLVTMEEILTPTRGGVSKVEAPERRSKKLQKWSDFAGERVKEKRKAAGLTQDQLAEKSGLPQSHISRIEKGEHSPTRFTLEKIAEALQIELRELDPSA